MSSSLFQRSYLIQQRGFRNCASITWRKKINKGDNYSLVSYVVLYVECKENEEYWEYREYTASLNTLLQILRLRIQIAMG